MISRIVAWETAFFTKINLFKKEFIQIIRCVKKDIDF